MEWNSCENLFFRQASVHMCLSRVFPEEQQKRTGFLRFQEAARDETLEPADTLVDVFPYTRGCASALVLSLSLSLFSLLFLRDCEKWAARAKEWTQKGRGCEVRDEYLRLRLSVDASTRSQSCVLDSQSFIVTAPRERNTKKVACARAATSSQARTTGNRRERKEEAGPLDAQEEEGRVLELSRRFLSA